MSALSESRRPRLLPQNRKLRHLRGVSLRNLSFTQTSRVRVPDDDSPSQSLNQLEVLRESGELRSSLEPESLDHDHDRDHDEEGGREQQEEEEEEGGRRGDVKGKRPVSPRLISPRRVSLTFAQASPSTRQQRLRSLIDDIVGDVFFTLHIDQLQEPIYISEVRERATNFNFRHFDFSDQSSLVARSCRLTVRLWVKRPKASWICLLEERIDLRDLNFIGTLQGRSFPPNALIFHLEDGVYSLDFPVRESEPKRAAPIATSTYNALMKLANLGRSIEDAIETQQGLMEQIYGIMAQNTAVEPFAAEAEAVVRQKYVAMQQRTNRQTTKQRDEKRESLRRRREAIAEGRALQAQVEKDIADNRVKLEASKELVAQTERQIHGQRRRICSELADIFAITPIPNQPPLSFQICGIPLPNSVYDAATARSCSLNEDVLSAGLGLVALLTHHLHFYLSRPLPYPITYFGSRSHARDDISILARDQTARRDFPLYLPRGGSTAGQWRFEYAWFLLNKDIEALCASQGLRVVDIRHTLPNIKYLLYVCSAGTEEVPLRKKGGVRGLWAGRLRGRLASLPVLAADGETGTGSAGGSRRASLDSDRASQRADSLRGNALKGSHTGTGADTGGRGDSSSAHGLGSSSPSPRSSERPDGPGGARGGEERERGSDASVDRNGNLDVLRFAEGEMKYTLRTKGLRENVAAK